MADIELLRAALQATGRVLIEQKLTWGNAGNLTARVDESTLLATASGTRLGELAGDDLVTCPLDATSVPQDYARKPTKELPMHRAIYQARPDIGAVIHAAPLYSTLIACADVTVLSVLFVETMYYLERVARVPYHHPGSQALGDAVAREARNANVIILENHGVLVYDLTLSEALMARQTLEAACQTIVIARSANIPLTQIPPATVQDFLDNAGYKPRRRWS
jgi:3-dehydro-4-phosphotetronate decarboxylase